MAASAHDLSLGLRPPAGSPSNRRLITGSLLTLGLLAAVAALLVTVAVTDRHGSLHAAHRAELEALARGRADVLATWLDGMAQLGRRFALSDRFQQFASALAANPPRAPLPRSLAAQLPYFRKLINEFAQQNGLVRVALVGLDGRWFLGSPNGPLTNPAERDALAATLERGLDRALTPVRHLHPGAPDDRSAAAQLGLDILLPVPFAEAPTTIGPTPLAAVLMMTVPVGDKLVDLLRPAPSQPASKVRLMQRAAEGTQQIVLDGLGRLALSSVDQAAAPGDLQPYGRRHDPLGTTVFAFGAPVPGLPWTVTYEIDAASALAPLRTFASQAVIAAMSVVLALVLAFVTFWWRRHAAHHREHTRLLQRLTARWGGQRPSEREGRIRRQPEGQTTGSRTEVMPTAAPVAVAVDSEIVGSTRSDRSSTAALSQADEPVLADGPLADGHGASAKAPATDNDDPSHGDRSSVVAAGGYRTDPEGAASLTIGPGQLERGSTHLPVAATESIELDERWRGILAIALGRTDLAEGPCAHESVARHTVGALLRAIELLDPFLIDHALRLRHYALAVGRHCGLGQAELGTLDLAARLSPIAKTFMPDRALVGRHAQAEPGVLRRDVAHAVHVLASIDVDLPVAEAVLQMHERLDGSGHPHRLRAKQIGVLARILSAVDAFCLQIGPRSGSDRLTPGNALYQLAQNPDHYDVTVISALAAVVAAGTYDHDCRSGRALPRQPAKARRLRLDEPTLTEAA